MKDIKQRKKGSFDCARMKGILMESTGLADYWNGLIPNMASSGNSYIPVAVRTGPKPGVVPKLGYR